MSSDLSWIEDWTEIETLFADTCLSCCKELQLLRYPIQWDSLARREATKALFKWHIQDHDWESDGKTLTGPYRVQKQIARRYYWESYEDFWYARSSLEAVNSSLFSQNFLGDLGETVGLRHLRKPEDSFKDALNKAKKGEFEDTKLKADLETRQRLQTSLQDLVLKLRAFQPAISLVGKLPDQKLLKEVRDQLSALREEADQLDDEY